MQAIETRTKTVEGFLVERERIITKEDLPIFERVSYVFGTRGLGAHGVLRPNLQVDARGNAVQEGHVRIIRSEETRNVTDFEETVARIIQLRSSLRNNYIPGLDETTINKVLTAAMEVTADVLRARVLQRGNRSQR